MKKVLFLLVSIVILGLVFAGCGGITNITAPSTSQDEIVYLTKEGTLADPISFPLYAGQHDLVGEVLVWDENEELCVKYRLFDGTGDDPEDVVADGWGITETHLAVGHEEGDIPQTKKGNPIPGEFLYGYDELEGVDSWQECIPFDELGKEEPGDLHVVCDDELVIAAHAVIEREVCESIEPAGYGFWVSNTDTMVVAGNVPGAVYPENAVLAWVYPQWTLLVDIPGLIKEPAQWIWESYHVVHPILGDVVTFEKEFEVPGIPTPGGSLYIVCDNSYDVYLNDVLLGSHDVWWEKKVYYLDPPVLVQGENTLRIEAVNAPQAEGNVESNPGGVKFSFCAHWDDYDECTTESETAWGAVAQGKTRFVKKGNWATYFTYTTNECE